MEEDFDPYFEGNNQLELSNRFERMLEMDDNYFFDVEEFEDLIDYYLNQSEIKKAKQVIDFSLIQHPTSCSLKLKQAQFYTETHQPNKALEILNIAENLEPFNSEISLTKANIYSQIRQHNKAIENYFKAVKLIDDSNEKANIYLNIAFEYENLSQFDKALNILKGLLNDNPENETVLYEIAFCYNLKNDTENGISFFTKFIDDYPFSYIAWFNLGIAYNKAELYEKAEEAYDYAIAIKDDFSAAYFNKANSLALQEKYKEAIAIFKETFNYEDPDATTYYYIGECYEKLEDNINAEKNYLKAIKLDAFCADAFAGLAVVSEYQGKDQVALESIKKALDLEINNSEYWYIYGDILAKIENIEEAIVAYYKVLELDKDNEEVWLDLAEAVKKNESIEKAILFLYEGMEKQSTNYSIYIRLSALLLEIGKADDAVEYLNIALSQNKELAQELTEYYPNAILFPAIVETLENYKK